MTKHEAYEYWLMRYNKAKDYDDPHWEAEEKAAHHRWLEAMEQAMEALKDTSVSVDNNDYTPREECTNPYTWGHICVKCGDCGRKFDKEGRLIDNE